MTHYNNWGEIPKILQRQLADKFFHDDDIVFDRADAIIRAANGELFDWAITQGLINKPEPKRGYFVPFEECAPVGQGRLEFRVPNAQIVFDNGDGTYSEVKTDE